MAGVHMTCQEGAPAYEACVFKQCAPDAITGVPGCVPSECLPGCFGKTCGDDGCGGSCGECGAGDECYEELGVCVPADGGCGDIDALGQCAGQVAARCVDGDLEVEDCLASGRLCADECASAGVECRHIPANTPCGDLPAWGHCAGDYAYGCEGGALTRRSCGDWIAFSTCKRVGPSALGCGF